MSRLRSGLLLLSCLFLFACAQDNKKKSSSKDDDNGVTQESVDQGNVVLQEIYQFEQQMENDGYIEFVDEVSSIRIKYIGDQSDSAEVFEARDRLRDYASMVERFLNDYPADKYTMTGLGREKLEAKLSLAKDMIEEIEDKY